MTGGQEPDVIEDFACGTSDHYIVTAPGTVQRRGFGTREPFVLCQFIPTVASETAMIRTGPSLERNTTSTKSLLNNLLLYASQDVFHREAKWRTAKRSQSYSEQEPQAAAEKHLTEAKMRLFNRL